MSRLRITLMTAATLLALVALTFNSLAQPPGRGGGGGGGRGGFGGPWGGFGGPGGGFGGPGGGSLLQLAQNPAVQEDLKLKDAQKAKIKSLSDKYNAQMQELRGQMGGGPGGFGGPGGPGGAPQGKGQGGRGGQNAGGQAAQPGGFTGGGSAASAKVAVASRAASRVKTPTDNRAAAVEIAAIVATATKMARPSPLIRKLRPRGNSNSP